MLIREREVEGRVGVNYYTTRRLGDMAESLSQLARALDDGTEKNGQLAKDDGPAAMQVSAALMCENCSRCNLYTGGGEEDSCYFYYLLRTFKQKGHIDLEGIPQMFQSGYRKKEDYLTQLSRSLGRTTMDLPRKSCFLENRDAVISQLRKLPMILGEFSHQIGRARDITDEYEYVLRKHLRCYHVALGNLLLLEYENGQKEAFPTARTTNGHYITSKDTALTMRETMDGTRWSPAKDSRSIITKQYEAVRFLEEGGYRILYGTFRISKKGEKYSGDNYTLCENPGNQVVMSLSDGMRSGKVATRESKQVVELTEQLLKTEFSLRVAPKLVSTAFLLARSEQHPVILDLSCIDLHTNVLEAMKLGAVPTFIIGEEGAEIMEVGEASMGALSGVEPVLMSRKLWEGDRIVMVSDGALNALLEDDKGQAAQQYLESVEETGPQEPADQVLDFTASFVSAPRDDMTVLAAGIWKRRS